MSRRWIGTGPVTQHGTSMAANKRNKNEWSVSSVESVTDLNETETASFSEAGWQREVQKKMCHAKLTKHRDQH